MAAENGFMIDGSLHEVPPLDSLNMDEAQVLYDYSGLTIEDFVKPEDVDDDEHQENLRTKLRNPGFIRALMHIAYQRANPRQNPSRVKQLVGQASLLGTLEHLAGEEAGDDPPASTPDSQTSSDDSSASSGDDSRPTSEGQVVPLAPTTTGGSDTSSASRLTNSAV